MVEKNVILFCLLISCQADPMQPISEDKKPGGSTTYDQRQSGKYNVHVNIKDVQFFSLSDSLASIGDYEDYGDYSDFEGIGEADTDYDQSHLTVNPVFAFLGSQKPTTVKPTTSAPTEKLPPASSTSSTLSTTSESTLSSIKEEASTSTEKTSSSSLSSTSTQESESEIKDSSIYSIKPASVEDKKPQQDEAIDYEEIPVEVQYYRAQHQKFPSRNAAINKFHKRPSVQIIDGHGRGNNNVKIIENDQTVKICGRGEFRDNLGRCRVRARRGAGAPGLRRLFNLFSSFTGARKN